VYVVYTILHRCVFIVYDLQELVYIFLYQLCLLCLSGVDEHDMYKNIHDGTRLVASSCVFIQKKRVPVHNQVHQPSQNLAPPLPVGKPQPYQKALTLLPLVIQRPLCFRHAHPLDHGS
jgi:hypothetical protein